jgi:predicted nucleic acid-binding protein
MAVNRYFYDSYAVIEYLEDNFKFLKYFEKSSGVLTVMNLSEIMYTVLITAGKEKAKLVMDNLWPLVVYPNKAEIIESIEFRRKHSKRNLSYADCLGYIIARKRGLKFLTGDIQFENMPNVEYVK